MADCHLDRGTAREHERKLPGVLGGLWGSPRRRLVHLEVYSEDSDLSLCEFTYGVRVSQAHNTFANAACSAWVLAVRAGNLGVRGFRPSLPV